MVAQMPQRYLDDFTPGEVFTSVPHALSEKHFAAFAAMTGDAHPLAFGFVEQQAAAAVVVEHRSEGSDDAVEQSNQFSKAKRGVPGLGKQPAQRLAVGESQGPAGLVVDFAGWVDAEAREDRGDQVGGGDGIEVGIGADAVAGAVDVAGQCSGHRVRSPCMRLSAAV